MFIVYENLSTSRLFVCVEKLIVYRRNISNETNQICKLTLYQKITKLFTVQTSTLRSQPATVPDTQDKIRISSSVCAKRIAVWKKMKFARKLEAFFNERCHIY